VLEYDTYGKTCLTDGSIVYGEVVSSNKYVCDSENFRAANEQDVTLNKGCVSYTDGTEIRLQLSSVSDAVYLCYNGLWNKQRIEFAREYDILIDKRDNKRYKTVVIGSQTWMAENLNFYIGQGGSGIDKYDWSWCYANSPANCTKYGRLYTWAAAMDSIGTFSTNGKGCGFGKECSPTYPARGICPEGWHLPSSAEYGKLITTVGGQSTAAKMLNSTSGWNSNGNGDDAFGFSALPAGQYYDYNGTFLGGGQGVYFWSSDEFWTHADPGIGFVSVMELHDSGSGYLNSNAKRNGFSVRCLMD
jgi:uncharacterized protein (TIGR02145 family)